MPAGSVARVRERLALALDFDDPVVAMRWAARLKPNFGLAKVGLELWSASGPSSVAELMGEGFRVFVDLKLADIPNTTFRAARVLGSLGASYLTVHAFAGEACLRAAVEGFREGAERGGFAPPVVLGVTVLTSERHAPPEVVAERARLSLEAGCGGVVCAAGDLAAAKQAAPGLLCVVPGIRLAGTGPDDQARPSSPGAALVSGADILVIGRAVTAAKDPEAAAQALVLEVTAALAVPNAADTSPSAADAYPSAPLALGLEPGARS
jgi:orotidine-5'-phosphate decarboxylase